MTAESPPAGEGPAGALGYDRFLVPQMTAPLDRGRLAAYLAELGMTLDMARPLRQFSGGLANRNYLMWVDRKPVVLRRPPDGDLPPGAHDMEREHRILARLHTGLSLAPRGLLYCGDRQVIGAPFQLIEYRQGIVFGASGVAGHESPAARSAVSAMLVQTLADIHCVDLARIGLGDLGHPDGFLKRAIAGWTARGIRIADPATKSIIRRLGDWLETRTFQKRRPAFLHGDFKLDNVLLKLGNLEPSAVLDWDMATCGDPGFDFATMLSYWVEPSDPDCLRLIGQMPEAGNGFLSRDAALRLYVSLTGANLDDIDELYSFAVLKLGVIYLQLHRQSRAGTAVARRYERFGALGKGLVRHAQDLAFGSRGG